MRENENNFFSEDKYMDENNIQASCSPDGSLLSNEELKKMTTLTHMMQYLSDNCIAFRDNATGDCGSYLFPDGRVFELWISNDGDSDAVVDEITKNELIGEFPIGD